MMVESSRTGPNPPSSPNEFLWEGWAVGWMGAVAASVVTCTIRFPRLLDYLLFPLWGVALSLLAYLAVALVVEVVLLLVALPMGRVRQTPRWTAQTLRFGLYGAPFLAFATIAFNQNILLREVYFLWNAQTIAPLALGLASSLAVFEIRRAVLRSARRRGGRRTSLVLLAGTAVVWGVGALVVWGRFREPPREAIAMASDSGEAPAPRRPVLVVGVDALGFETLQETLGSHELPTLERLRASGTVCPVTGDPSFNSCGIFCSFATAASPEQHGVKTHFHVKFPGISAFPAPETARNLWAAYALGLPLLAMKWVEAYPPPEDSWRVEPLWRRAHAMGLRTGVVGWLGSWPPSPRDGPVFPYMGARSSWEVFYRYSPERFAGTGCFASEEYRALVRQPSDADARELAAIGVDEGVGAHGLGHGSLSLLNRDEVGYVRLERLGDLTHAALAEKAIREGRPDLFWVYFGGYDVVAHFFWPVWKPEAYPGGAKRPVPPRERQPVLLYLKWIDAEIARLIASYAEPPVVVIVGDHDMTASPGNPLFPAWHGGHGSMVFSCPGKGAVEVKEFVRAEDVGDLVARLCGLGTGRRWKESPLRPLAGD